MSLAWVITHLLFVSSLSSFHLSVMSMIRLSFVLCIFTLLLVMLQRAEAFHRMTTSIVKQRCRNEQIALKGLSDNILNEVGDISNVEAQVSASDNMVVPVAGIS